MSVPINLPLHIARMRFRQRATEMPNGDIVYRLANGDGYVRLSNDEWHELGDFFSDRAGASNRRATGGILLAPLVLLGIPLFGFIPGVALVLVGMAVLGVPLMVYFRHSARVEHISLVIDRELRTLPRVPRPEREQTRVPFLLDLALMLFFAPHLFISILVSAYPEGFEGSPLDGVRFDWLSVVGVMLLVLRYAWPKWAPRVSEG